MSVYQGSAGRLAAGQVYIVTPNGDATNAYIGSTMFYNRYSVTHERFPVNTMQQYAASKIILSIYNPYGGLRGLRL